MSCADTKAASNCWAASQARRRAAAHFRWKLCSPGPVMAPDVRARLPRLPEPARRAADPQAPLAEAWRERIGASSGLSREGVDLALSRCLETEPSEAELIALAASVMAAPVSPVLLSANVFV